MIKTNVYLLLLAILFLGCTDPNKKLTLKQNERIVFIGDNLCSRMMIYSTLETAVHMQFPDNSLFIRNMCDGGDTPGFRPHSARNTPWAFPGAENFNSSFDNNISSTGFFEYPDEWLTRLEAETIFSFFGYSESFAGPEGLENFKSELQAFVEHTLSQKYNGKEIPNLVLFSPTAIENLSDSLDVPDGIAINVNLELYTTAIKEVADDYGLIFVDLFHPSLEWYSGKGRLTIDGLQLNEKGYELLSDYVVSELFDNSSDSQNVSFATVNDAVKDKNWYWHMDYKVPNGVHVFGRRFDPYGPDNYPHELKKVREMTANRDTAIWMACSGAKMDLEAADTRTYELPEVETNYQAGGNGHGSGTYLYGQDALDQLHVAPGYKIELFASEKEFPELANPVQISFDNKGRLWVAVMPTYPHYKPGDPRPNDKLIILEDTDGDGKADKQKVWADGLHIPVGFELAPEGVYISQGTNLKLFTDTDGDDKADKEEIILSGFDDHDTHHVISAFCADPSGAIYMGEGIFLHSNVETLYGTVRGTNGGFYRYNPAKHQLERTAQVEIPNPWGIAFDDWGQNFYLETSGPALRWMMPSTTQSKYGSFAPKSKDLAPDDQKVRPTSGLEIVSSRHFPDEVQGDIILGNAIGFLGIKQHQIVDEGTGYKTKFKQDLVWSDDTNFRPVDMEFAPDGSLYLVDWHNVLVGHMQHNARDPLRDHVHGRIYRMTYPNRPLLEWQDFDELSVEDLLHQLKAPEYRTRYRAKRTLRGRTQEDVRLAVTEWVNKLDVEEENYSQYLLEALWVTWGINAIDESLVEKLLSSDNMKARAAAIRVIRYNQDKLPKYFDCLKQGAEDPAGRVRLEAVVAASWLEKEQGLEIIALAEKLPLDEWMEPTVIAAKDGFGIKVDNLDEENEYPEHLDGSALEFYIKGKEVYEKDGYCGTCHQMDGKGLPAAGFPPLADSEWVIDDKETLIKLTLKGLQGPITVKGKEYPGHVPMTAFENLLGDDEVAAVLTYVRNSFGNKASPVTFDDVYKAKAAAKDHNGFYNPKDLKK